ncbi:MAG: stalk domain-containing protein [Bacillota bacterium]|jgi:hypothetical protein
MKLLKTLILTLVFLAIGTSAIYAEEVVKKPLDQVFDQTIIVPFNYNDKVFLKGQKVDVYGDYKIYERNDRVLVPIRMMSYLVDELDSGYWQVNWDAKAPKDVVLNNHQLNKTVKLQVNSKTMYINNEPVNLDVPPQNINGRVVLPLRGISEALDKKVAWLDGLIILGNDHVDLQNPKTLGIKEKISDRLADKRVEVDYEKRVRPVTKYNDTIYYIRTIYLDTGIMEELYQKTGSAPEVKIDLPGKEKLTHYRVINNELYYISKIDDKSELHVFDFADQRSRKLCDLGDWNPEDGWLSGMRYINNEFYVILHSGDLTMGWERLYKLEDGVLNEIAGAKSFTHYDVVGDYLYYVDFHPMSNWANNLFRVNLKTGEKDNLGDPEFTYGIFRKAYTDGGVGYSHGTTYVYEGNIYTLGHKESDPDDQSSVYKITLDGTYQKKLTLPAKRFWLVNEEIYYTDSANGTLIRVDLEGNNETTLVNERVIDVKFFDGNIYYTASKTNNDDVRLGRLYKYNIASGQEIQLSDNLVSEFFVGKAGVYYNAEGYDLGLYKIDSTEGTEKSTCLEDDSLYSALLTDTGIVYTLRYEDGVYFVK